MFSGKRPSVTGASSKNSANSPSFFGAGDAGAADDALIESGREISALPGGERGRSFDGDGDGLESRDRDATRPPKPPRPPKLGRVNPRPAGFCFGWAGATGRGFEEYESGRGVDSGERTRPASFIAACSSVFVGSLIGDLARPSTGEEEAEFLPHNAVAFLTEKAGFSGEGGSLGGGVSGFGDEIGFKTGSLGDSTDVLAGGVGRGRENRDCSTTGDGDAGFGELTDSDRGVWAGLLASGLFSSSAAGFLGRLGDETLDVPADSGWGDLWKLKLEELLLSESAALDLLGISGDSNLGVAIGSKRGECFGVS
jgi:hypothetical protein